MDRAAYGICIELYGACSCILNDRPPCEAMLSLADDGEGSWAELERMEVSREEAESELF